MSNEESLITDEIRALVGKPAPPVQHEVDKSMLRLFARSVGYTDPVFYDEAYARSKGHRSLVAPPGFAGIPVFDPRQPRPPRLGPARLLNGGQEWEYTGVEICAGDVLTAVTTLASAEQRTTSLGPMLITRWESVFTNQLGETVGRYVITFLQY
jgi:N-terminal half of MaoC dehydratase